MQLSSSQLILKEISRGFSQKYSHSTTQRNNCKRQTRMKISQVNNRLFTLRVNSRKIVGTYFMVNVLRPLFKTKLIHIFKYVKLKREILANQVREVARVRGKRVSIKRKGSKAKEEIQNLKRKN